MSDAWGEIATPLPTITVIGKFRGGMLVRAEWSGQQHQLSERTMEGLKVLGVNIVDDPANYLFSGPVI
jgi:hypothetical protein